MAHIDGPSFRLIDPKREKGWRAALAEHLLRLDPEQRRLRFLGTIGEAGVRAHVARAAPLALVTFAPGGVIRGCAELYPGDAPGSAEIAVSVESAWQNRGIGAALTAEASQQARNAGLSDIRLTCLRQNTPMMHIARSLSARALPLADWALALFRLETPEPS